MGEITEFSTSIRLFLKAYPWRRIDPVPSVQLTKPLADCRLALVSSAGFVGPEHEPFDDSVRGGDVSFRDIPFDIDPARLIDTHRSESFDHSGMTKDRP